MAETDPNINQSLGMVRDDIDAEFEDVKAYLLQQDYRRARRALTSVYSLIDEWERIIKNDTTINEADEIVKAVRKAIDDYDE